MGTFRLKRTKDVILAPTAEHPWESRATFNPAAVRENDIIHLLYRAVEGDNYSTIGYAKLRRDGTVIYRHPEPVILRELPNEKRGCEDPRISRLQDRYYIFYTGYDGEKVRVMMAETRDFREYRKLGQVGPDHNDKDAMIFPDFINGKVAFLHRIEPNIQLALFESIEHLLNPEPAYWKFHLENLDKFTVMYKTYDWEAEKIGAGPTPLRTDAGWLLIYHGVDKNFTYRAGAALLDAKDPYKVIARLPYPILEPERDYEKVGDVSNVVFPEGAVIFDDELLVFYGGADKVTGLAVGKLSQLLDALWKHRI